MPPRENFLKITYHDGCKKLHAYLRMPSPTFAVLKKEIDMCLFDERKQPRCETRMYWIDADGDEIELVHQSDYEIFWLKCGERQHLQVSAICEPLECEKQQATSTDAAPPTGDDPSAFVIHDHVECDVCKVQPIIGFRYKCIQCPNFDLCQRCEAAHKHGDHMMIRLPTTRAARVNIIDAMTNGRAGRRASKRFNRAAGCPFMPETAPAGGDAPPPPPPAFCGTEHRHHKHSGRRLRNGIFTHLYEMMHDLAEGGAPTDEQLNQTNETAEAATKAADAAAKVATAHAEEAAKSAHAAAVKAAEAAHKAAHEAATNAAQQLFSATEVNATAPSAQQTQQPQEDTPKKAAGNAEPQVQQKQSTSNNATPKATTPSASGPGGFDLNTIAQFIDPETMKSGIQILNNFSEMFAKMLDPIDDTNCGVEMPYGSRKNSNVSSTASSSSGASTSAAAKDAAAKAAAAANAAAHAASATEAANNAAAANAAAAAMKRADVQKPADVPMETQAAAEESLSADNDESSIIELPSPADSEADFEMLNDIEGAAVAVANAPEISFEQLSKDLKSHIEQEERAAAAKPVDIMDTPVPASATTAEATSTTTNTQATVKPAELKPATIVYHADERINQAVHAMMAMGFSNEGAWLTQLLQSVNGNISEALDLMNVAQRASRQ